MVDISAIAKRNRDVANEYKKYLRMMPKVIAIHAAEKAMASAMEPARMLSLGDKMVHGSSNAAWNWRITFGSPEPALEHYGRGSIGSAYSTRSWDGDPMMFDVISERLQKDIYKKLFNRYFSSSNVYKKSEDFVMYNSIGDLPHGEIYSKRANLKNAGNKLNTIAKAGAQMGYQILNHYMTGGKFGTTPNVKGLEGYLIGRFQNAQGNI